MAGKLPIPAFMQTLTAKPVDFSAKTVYFMRVLAGFNSQAGKNKMIILETIILTPKTEGIEHDRRQYNKNKNL